LTKPNIELTTPNDTAIVSKMGTVMGKVRKWWEHLSNTGRKRILILFVLVSAAVVFILLSGVISNGDWKGVLFNLGIELSGTAITFLLIDLFIGSEERREAAKEQRKQRQLEAIERLRTISKTVQVNPHEVMQPIVDEMIAYKLFQRANLSDMCLINLRFGDADLRGANLNGTRLHRVMMWQADLQGARLSGTILEGAYLNEVNLKGVKSLTNQQLANVQTLQGSIMVNGKRYDGRFNLPRDLESAAGSWGIDINNDEQMAAYYGVPVKVYKKGQKWATENLPKLRGNKLQ
jgi:hypothetical protein